MSIADKLSTIADNVPLVYQAGRENGYNYGVTVGYQNGYNDGKAEASENALKYAKQVDGLFSGAKFPDGYELVVELDDETAPTNLTGMFRNVTGLAKLTFDAPTDRTYNGSYFIYGSSSTATDVKELILPDGIKFSDFSRFVGYSRSLKTITGRIDLSENTTTQYSFNYCSSLEEVRFTPGTIGLSISFSHSPKLSDASIESIINGLSADAVEQTLTVHPDVAARIIEADVTDKGWSLAY